MKRGTKDMPPHTFNIADNAYRALVEKKINQSILISGESGTPPCLPFQSGRLLSFVRRKLTRNIKGAGKTECTKQCLNYFAELAGSTNGVEQNILLANPILEAFGNAKTLRKSIVLLATQNLYMCFSFFFSILLFKVITTPRVSASGWKSTST